MSISAERNAIFWRQQYYDRRAEWIKALDVQWICGRHLAALSYKCPLYRDPGSEEAVKDREAITKAYEGYMIADGLAQEAERRVIQAHEDWEEEKGI